jgi:hypothetical protein
LAIDRLLIWVGSFTGIVTDLPHDQEIRTY